MAVKLYGYKPTMGARVEVFLQDIVVAVLPAGLVFPLYSFLRGMKVNIYRSIVDGLVIKTREKMNVREVLGSSSFSKDYSFRPLINAV